MRRVGAINGLFLFPGLWVGALLQATPTGLHCSATPINDPSYAVVVKFQVQAGASNGSFDLNYERAQYSERVWSVERWSIPGLKCSHAQSALKCKIPESSARMITFDKGEYRDDPRTSHSKFVPKSSKTESLAGALLDFSVKISRVDNETRHNYRLVGKLDLPQKRLVHVNQAFRECEIGDIFELASVVDESSEDSSDSSSSTDSSETVSSRPPVEPPLPVRRSDLPYGIPVPDEPNLIRSPHGTQKILDISGLPSGAKVKDPYSGKLFYLP